MAFLRFSRDKRGYEHFYLIETPQQRGRSSRSRILYWFRTPPGVKVGREPFDAEARRILESHNPGAQFDWQKFISTPIPAVEPEHWRERRRVERAAKIAARAEAAADSDTPDIDAGEVGTDTLEIESPVVETLETSPVVDATDSLEAVESPRAADVVASSSEGPAPTDQPGAGARSEPHHRRRRRRRGRRSGPSGAILSAGTLPPESPRESPETSEPAEPSATSESFDPGEGGDV